MNRRNHFLMGWLFCVMTAGGCSTENISQTEPNEGLYIAVEQMLRKEEADSTDYCFITSLSHEQLESILERLGAVFTSIPNDTCQPSLENNFTVMSWRGEVIECGYGSGGTISGGWFHTTLCGGDSGDHFYFYDNVPSAYSEPWRIKGRSKNTSILLVLAYYGWHLSSRIYESNDVFVCVGSAIHWPGGPTHETWRTKFYLYRS